MKHRLWIVVVVALGACKKPSQIRQSRSANDGRAHAKKIASGTLHIDGRLDEAVWQTAKGTGPFVHPGTGQPEPRSQVQGEAWFAWDNTALYVAARVEDRAPVMPFARTEEDPHLWERSSAIELMLQPGDPGDNRNYYEIQIDPACAIWSTHFDDYNQPQRVGSDGRRRFGHQEWSPTIACAAHVESGGYVIEFAVPWSALDGMSRTQVPPVVGATWRANVYSFRDGQRDALAWSALQGQGNFHFAPRFARLLFGGT
jgi:Carbohydrate family 9 binding domain-like